MKCGSDIMVDAIKEYDFPYISLNPGASFKGLHDSLANDGGNEPEMIEAPNEKVAVGITHGYAKASGDPMVVVHHRAYYNDREHQEAMERLRGTLIENACLGMEIDNPAPDFAAIARAFGWHGDGLITKGDDIQDAVRRAAEIVSRTGQPALVDVVCQRK